MIRSPQRGQPHINFLVPISSTFAPCTPPNQGIQHPLALSSTCNEHIWIGWMASFKGGNTPRKNDILPKKIVFYFHKRVLWRWWWVRFLDDELERMSMVMINKWVENTIAPQSPPIIPPAIYLRFYLFEQNTLRWLSPMGGLKVAAAGLQVRVEVTQLPPPSEATLWGYPVANPGCSARIKCIWQGNGGDWGRRCSLAFCWSSLCSSQLIIKATTPSRGDKSQTSSVTYHFSLMCAPIARYFSSVKYHHQVFPCSLHMKDGARECCMS